MGTVTHKAYVKSVVASIWDRTCEGNSCQLQNTPAVNTGMAPPLDYSDFRLVHAHSGSLSRQATLLTSPAVGGALRALQKTAVEQTCGTD